MMAISSNSVRNPNWGSFMALDSSSPVCQEKTASEACRQLATHGLERPEAQPSAMEAVALIVCGKDLPEASSSCRPGILVRKSSPGKIGIDANRRLGSRNEGTVWLVLKLAFRNRDNR